MKNVRTVGMRQDSVPIQLIEGVSAHVPAPVDDQYALAGARQPFRTHGARKARPNDQHVVSAAHCPLTLELEQAAGGCECIVRAR